MRLGSCGRQANHPSAGAAGVVGGHDHTKPSVVTGPLTPLAGSSMLARVAPTALHEDLVPGAARLVRRSRPLGRRASRRRTSRPASPRGPVA